MNYKSLIEEMEYKVIKSLEKLDPGYGKIKREITKETGIPEDILTPILKRLKYAGKIQLVVIWGKEGPKGSGYCIA